MPPSCGRSRRGVRPDEQGHTSEHRQGNVSKLGLIVSVADGRPPAQDGAHRQDEIRQEAGGVQRRKQHQAGEDHVLQRKDSLGERQETEEQQERPDDYRQQEQ